MNIKKILDNVYYVGVNDNMTKLFEGLWPLPYGVSYNSYIVKGEKIALIDTVHKDNSKQFIENIKKVICNQSIDYIIVNHMEPDHSGSLNDVLTSYPDAKIICTKVAYPMIKGFYGISDESKFQFVKDGDEINLGNYSLQFFTAPMVHWPETMVTYFKEEKILFSGDAFGTFGSLNSDVIDSNISTDLYFNEMYRYYSNIVGKYGRFVQKALEKLSGLEINYICSTHGPIWHSKIKEVINITDKLSKYETEEGVVIVYGSMYGNTQKATEHISAKLNECGVKKIIIHNASSAEMSDMISDAFRYKGLIICSPTYSGSIFPPIDAFLTALKLREIKNHTVAVLGSFTWASSAEKLIRQQIEEMKLDLVGSIAMPHRPNAEILSQIDKLITEFCAKI